MKLFVVEWDEWTGNTWTLRTSLPAPMKQTENYYRMMQGRAEARNVVVREA